MKPLFKLFSIFAIVASLTACGQVNTGERGFKVQYGKIVSEVLGEGLYFFNPFTTDLITMDTRTQRMDNKTKTLTKDVQEINLVYSVNYNLMPNKVKEIYTTVGQNSENVIIYPEVDNVLKNVIGQYDASDLNANRSKVTDLILAELQKSLLVNNIQVSNFVISTIGLSEEFTNAVEEKKREQEKAQTEAYKTQQAQEKANQILIAEKANAEALDIKGKAINNNPQLIEYEKLQVQSTFAKKWDGKLPVNMYGSAPMPFLNISK